MSPLARRRKSGGITGYAVNLADGSVEVLACGDREVLDRLANWLQQGPPMARVTSVSESGHEGGLPRSILNRLTPAYSLEAFVASPAGTDRPEGDPRSVREGQQLQLIFRGNKASDGCFRLFPGNGPCVRFRA